MTCNMCPERLDIISIEADPFDPDMYVIVAKCLVCGEKHIMRTSKERLHKFLTKIFVL